MSNFEPIIEGIDQASYEVAPEDLVRFVNERLRDKFEGQHNDYVEFIKAIHNFYIGDVDGNTENGGYVYFSMFPVEDTFDLENPFESRMYCVAEAEENVSGLIHNAAYYVCLDGGVYCSTYE